MLLARMAGAPCVRAKQSAVERPLHGVLNDTRQYRERFLITKGDEFCMLCADHTSYINMHDNRITAFAVDGTAYPLPMNMNDLEQALNPDRLFRLNRQYIANINGLRKISFYFSSKLIVRLKSKSCHRRWHVVGNSMQARRSLKRSLETATPKAMSLGSVVANPHQIPHPSTRLNLFNLLGLLGLLGL